MTLQRLYIFSFTLALSLALVVPSFAQRGIATYEEVVKMNIELPPEMEHMRDQFPDSHTSTKLLYFDQTASLFKTAPSDEEEKLMDVKTHHGGGVFHMKMDQAENETYVNYDEDLRIEKRDFMGRVFLITGEASRLLWKLTDERSEFLGYICQKAVAQQDSTTYEAWFTPEISIPSGPGYGGLPGLILVLDIDDGQRSLVVQELSLDGVEAGMIVPPKKGKKVSQEEFDAIVEEKMKEMNMTGKGRGNVIMQIQHP